MILAIDTAADDCTVALASPGELRMVRGAPGQTRLEHAMPLVHGLLGGPDGLLACEAFAFGAGPGAFTGLRVACTLAQGFGYASGKPVLAIGNLEAIAWAALAGEGTEPRPGLVLVAVDARMGEAYAGAWRSGGAGELACVREPFALPLAGLPDLVRELSPDALAGNAFPLAGIGARGPGLADAGTIARIAMLRLAAGGGKSARDAAPCYVRDRVALTVAERSAGLRL